MGSTKEILAQIAGGAVVAVAILVVTAHAVAGGKDPRYATPRATLQSYERAVLAVDEKAELATGSAELRALAERNRGADKTRRIRSLRGKAGFFRQYPMQIEGEKVWGNRARILVIQGGRSENPMYWVYSFIREKGDWKISNIERTLDMGW